MFHVKRLTSCYNITMFHVKQRKVKRVKHIRDYIVDTLVLTATGAGVAVIAGLVAFFAPLLVLFTLDFE